MDSDRFVTAGLMNDEMTKCRDQVKTEISDWLDKHERMEFARHDQTDQSLRELMVSVSMLTEAFSQGKGAVNLLKWLAILVTGAWAVLVWAKDHLKI